MRVKNPQLGKQYPLRRNDGVFLRRIRLVGMDHIYYHVLPAKADIDSDESNDMPLCYARDKYYLTENKPSKNKEYKLEPDTQATKPELFTEDFLQKSREIKEMATELKKCLDEQTKKLIQDMTTHASKVGGGDWNFNGVITEWTLIHYWSNTGLYKAKIYTRCDALMDATPEIIEQWRSLCELKIVVDKFA